MKKLFVAFSLCACVFSASAQQIKTKRLPVGEKVVDIKVVGDVSNGWTYSEKVYVITRPMERDEIAECYKVYEVESRFHTVERICESKE